MVDTNYFKYVMKKNGDNMESLAASLNISRTSLSQKINNKQDFKLSEIYTICKKYNITIEEGSKIFVVQRAWQ